MTVQDLINRLNTIENKNAEIIMCMDWTALPEKERPSDKQFEDDLGDIAWLKKGNFVYLLNKNFK